MYYGQGTRSAELGALGISAKVKVKLPKPLTDFLQEFPKTQNDVSRLTSVAERVTDFLPVVLVGGTAIAAIFIILKSRGKQE